jgi:hypothetical protein
MDFFSFCNDLLMIVVICHWHNKVNTGFNHLSVYLLSNNLKLESNLYFLYWFIRSDSRDNEKIRRWSNGGVNSGHICDWACYCKVWSINFWMFSLFVCCLCAKRSSIRITWEMSACKCLGFQETLPKKISMFMLKGKGMCFILLLL